jgi:hypothetical protein
MSENEQESHADEIEEKADESVRKRLQLDFSDKAYEKLNLLKQKADVKTNAELVRNALRLFEWFLEQKEENAKIHVVRGNEAKEVELIF